VITYVSEIGQHGRGQNSSGTETEGVELVGAGDLPDDVHGPQYRRGVHVQVVLAVVGAWVAPADDEHGKSPRHGMLDEAAVRGEVHEVVLADLGGY
jgi:hypothetical protein